MWQYILDTDQKYKISDAGVIVNIMTNKVVKPYTTKDGYMQVCLFVKGRRVKRYVHRLLIEAFNNKRLLPNEDVHHVDGNKKNNCAENLQIISHKQHSHLHKTVYHDIDVKCAVCGTTFFWTAKQQSNFARNKNKKNEVPFCSRSCAAKSIHMRV